jgi:transcriptional regulator with XRE-family HTH domain
MSEALEIEPAAASLNLLAEWIGREQLAQQLMVTPDTLSRWEAKRVGPPCMRIGRKVFYRRASVEQWLLSREQNQPVRQRRSRR